MSEATTASEEISGAAGAQASETGGSSSTAESDFKEHARRDPDWAWEQLRSFQSKYDKAASAEEKHRELVQKNGNAQALIDQYGADVVTQAVSNYATLRNSDRIGQVVQAFEQTGKLPERIGSETNPESEDEYMTPEEKENKELRAELEAVKQRVSEQSFSQGRTTLDRHMQEVFDEFEFKPEDVEKIRAKVVGQFQSWQREGATGEKALRAIMTDAGKEAIRGIMLSGITAKALREAAINVDLRKRTSLSELDTDVPSDLGSTGKELPSNFKSAIEVARACRANPNAFDSR